MRTLRTQRVGFIACGGGGVIDALCRLQQMDMWPLEIAVVVTDRPCGAERVAAEHDLTLASLYHPPTAAWSAAAADVLRRMEVDCVVLLFLRRVGPEVYRDLGVPVLNLHPSLLPAYPGIGALDRNFDDARRAAEQGRQIPMGVTAHVATNQLDGGPIVGQRSFSISEAPTLERAAHLAYVYKVALLLDAVHCLANGQSLPAAEVRSANNPIAHSKSCEADERLTEALSSIAQPWAAQVIQREARGIVI
jgi:phosphoribosylglycinamide formyltransferase 1